MKLGLLCRRLIYSWSTGLGMQYPDVLFRTREQDAVKWLKTNLYTLQKSIIRAAEHPT